MPYIFSIYVFTASLSATHFLFHATLSTVTDCKHCFLEHIITPTFLTSSREPDQCHKHFWSCTSHLGKKSLLWSNLCAIYSINTKPLVLSFQAYRTVYFDCIGLLVFFHDIMSTYYTSFNHCFIYAMLSQICLPIKTGHFTKLLLGYQILTSLNRRFCPTQVVFFHTHHASYSLFPPSNCNRSWCTPRFQSCRRKSPNKLFQPSGISACHKSFPGYVPLGRACTSYLIQNLYRTLQLIILLLSSSRSHQNNLKSKLACSEIVRRFDECQLLAWCFGSHHLIHLNRSILLHHLSDPRQLLCFQVCKMDTVHPL